MALTSPSCSHDLVFLVTKGPTQSRLVRTKDILTAEQIPKFQELWGRDGSKDQLVERRMPPGLL